MLPTTRLGANTKRICGTLSIAVLDSGIFKRRNRDQFQSRLEVPQFRTPGELVLTKKFYAFLRCAFRFRRKARRKMISCEKVSLLVGG